MTTLVRNLALWTVVWLAVWLCFRKEADAIELIQLKELSVDIRSYAPGSRSPEITSNGIPNRTLGEFFGMTSKVALVKYFYWDTTVGSQTDRIVRSDGSTAPGQFRSVNLEYGLGIDFRTFKWPFPARLGYYHFSEHELDGQLPWSFPAKDAIELKIFLYEGKK